MSEDLKVKQSCYDALQAAGLPEDSVLATNTSSISITKLAAKVSRHADVAAVAKSQEDLICHYCHSSETRFSWRPERMIGYLGRI